MATRSLSPWVRRPREIGNLLNPAFGALLLRAATKGHLAHEQAGLPLPPAYLILPIVLHQQTRESLRATIKTRLHTWLQDNPIVAIGFSERAAQIAPYTREALVFGAQLNVVRLRADARLEIVPGRFKANVFP